jgi:hypothetical protein
MLAIVLAMPPGIPARVARAQSSPHLVVRGTSRLEARGGPASPGNKATLAVSGTLIDDAGQVIAGVPLALRLVADDGSTLGPRACHGADSSRAALPAGPDGTVSLTTEADGTFCAFADARPGATTASLSYSGDHLLAGARAELTIDIARKAVTLSFDPEPRVISLGEGPMQLRASAQVAESEGPRANAGLPLRLSDERGVPLGSATTDAQGVARFTVPAASLGGAGPGEIRLAFDGDALRARAVIVVPCERRVAVLVVGHDGGAGKAGVASSPGRATLDGDDATAEVDVTTATGELVGGGSVEALVEGAVLGVAPVAKGRASLGFAWPESPGVPRAHVEVRYVPDVPWYVAGRPASLEVTAAHGTLVRRALVLLAALALFGWFALSRSARIAALRPRVRPGRVDGALDDEPSDEPEPEPRMDVVEDARGEGRGWTGHVVDAHDGRPVRGPRVAVERGSFGGGVVVVASTRGDVAGRFELPPFASEPTDTLVVEGPLHARLDRRLPGRGTLSVALIARRRAVLRRLLDWARQRGAPFDARPEPTPEQVRRAAGDDARTARWAREVEHAAFGPEDVDAAREAEVDRLAHGPVQGGDGGTHDGPS